MAEAITLGRMTDTMEEGFVAELNVKVGDKIKSGDTVAEIETDKATLPLESYFNGTILHIAVKKGDTLQIGDLIAVIGKEGEDISSIISGGGAKKESKKEGDTKEAKAETTTTKTDKAEPQKSDTSESKKQEDKQQATPAAAAETMQVGDRVKASPLARMIAKEKGIDLGKVRGTGEDGRIVRRDLENAAIAPKFVGKEASRDVRVSQMRKTIAKRLGESKNGAPHFYLTVDISMDNAVALRTQLNAVLPAKVSFNDIVIKSVALAIRQYPDVNCSWLGDTIRYYDHIHIGMAVAVDDGLLVPVIKFADGKTVQQISVDAKSLAEKATSKKLQPEEMQGNTFTISNLGMFGIEEFTAIINPPDACILAIGAIRQEPGVVNGEVKVVNKMKVTLSCDHRVVDGATGAKFLQVLRKFLEEPVRVLL